MSTVKDSNICDLKNIFDHLYISGYGKEVSAVGGNDPS